MDYDVINFSQIKDSPHSKFTHREPAERNMNDYPQDISQTFIYEKFEKGLI